MKVTIGEKGLTETHQNDFCEETKCVHCDSIARIGFVAHEDGPDGPPYVCDLHRNEKGSMWLHDCCSVAVYFCTNCLKPTAAYNQG